MYEKIGAVRVVKEAVQEYPPPNKFIEEPFPNGWTESTVDTPTCPNTVLVALAVNNGSRNTRAEGENDKVMQIQKLLQLQLERH